jgi:hypothetical protein
MLRSWSRINLAESEHDDALAPNSPASALMFITFPVQIFLFKSNPASK